MLKTEMRNPKSTNIDKMQTLDMVKIMNEENYVAVRAVEAVSEQIAKAVDAVTDAFSRGGRLFYVGAGTSGRLGVLDAAECPPTYGVDYGKVVGIIAGGEKAITRASEIGEDNGEAGIESLKERGVTSNDVVVGVSAAGGANFVVSALNYAKSLGCTTVGVTSNYGSKLDEIADISIVTDAGAEVITGSTRLKAGSAQKMVLNTISTLSMVKSGYVYQNLMINLKPSNVKLRARMISIVSEIAKVDQGEAEALLENNDWNIRRAVGEDVVEK